MTTTLHPINQLAAPSAPNLQPNLTTIATRRARTCDDAVLILDGDTRSALAATRSLGRRGIRVIVGDKTRRTLAGASHFCSETITYPDPAKLPDEFISFVRTECLERRADVVLPMAEMSTTVILQHRSQLEPLVVPFPEFETFDRLSDKAKLVKFAQELGIRVPKTELVADVASLEPILGNFTFPVVIKPRRSIFPGARGWRHASVRYANSVQEIRHIVAQHECFSRHPFLIQEYVPGESRGTFALYNRGRAVQFFSHRRLRENPPSGGVSVLCESAEHHPEALSMAKTLLDSVAWHGVAMVEFKISPHGTPYLIEVNGRFWGSLQLSIDSGVDFPWLVHQLATGKELDAVREYSVGIRSRWLLGDLAAVMKALFGETSLTHTMSRRKLSLLIQVLNVFDGSRGDVNRWTDFKPFLLEFSQALQAIIDRFSNAGPESQKQKAIRQSCPLSR